MYAYVCRLIWLLITPCMHECIYSRATTADTSCQWPSLFISTCMQKCSIISLNLCTPRGDRVVRSSTFVIQDSKVTSQMPYGASNWCSFQNTHGKILKLHTVPATSDDPLFSDVLYVCTVLGMFTAIKVSSLTGWFGFTKHLSEKWHLTFRTE